MLSKVSNRSSNIDLTIAVITYNRVQYLKTAIDGILSQTFGDFEFLILDNGSSYETEQLVKGYNDPRIVYIRNERNVREFYNVAFTHSKGEFLLITHDDDLLLPNFISKTFEKIKESPSIILVATNAYSINDVGSKICGNIMKIHHDLLFRQYEYIRYYLSGNVGIICPTALLRKNFFMEKNLLFDFEKGPATDTFLWTNCNLFDCKMVVLSEQLYAYRIHNQQDSVLNNLDMNTRLYLELFKLFRSQDGLSKYVRVVYARTLLNIILKLNYKDISRSEFDILMKELRISNLGSSLIVFNWTLVYISRFSLRFGQLFVRGLYFLERKILTVF